MRLIRDYEFYGTASHYYIIYISYWTFEKKMFELAVQLVMFLKNVW